MYSNNNSELEFNEIESFSLMFNSLWSSDDPARCRANIPDTIFFKNGLPYRWLFTSDKTGEVMKKTSDKLGSTKNIIRLLKQRATDLRGLKTHHVRTKIATVYYLESNAALTTSLLDEQEVAGLLKHPKPEVLALQVFIGGHPLKASGVFEHRVWLPKLNKRGTNAAVASTIQHATMELATLDPESYDTMSESNRLLAVTESQHDMIVILAKRILKQIERVANARVIEVIFEVVFNSSWTPIVIAARSIRMDNVPPYLESNAEKFALVYVGGEAPQVPPVRGGRVNRSHSIFNVLPPSNFRDHSVSRPELAMVNQFVAQQQEPATTGNSNATTNFDTSAHKGVAFSPSSKKLTRFDIPSPDFTKPFSNTEFEATECASALDVNPKDMALDMKRDTIMKDRLTGRGRSIGQTATGDGTESLFLQIFLQTKGEKPIRRRPLSASINRQTALNKNPDTGRVVHDVKTATAPRHHRHLQATEASKYHLNHYDKLIRDREDLVNGHYKHTDDGLPLTAILSQRLRQWTNEGHGVDGKIGRRATSIERKMTNLGSTCFGDYCDVLARFDYEHGRKVVKTTHCPYALAFKSVLLCRAETAFLCENLSDDDKEYMETLVELRKQSSDADQFLATYSRQHLFQVGKKCEQKARSFLFTDDLMAPEHSSWDKLHAHYRRLVYAEALTMVHPSRFYYTVPVCEVCYKVYTYMDSERDNIVLHDPVHHIEKTHKSTVKKLVQRGKLEDSILQSMASSVASLARTPKSIDDRGQASPPRGEVLKHTVTSIPEENSKAETESDQSDAENDDDVQDDIPRSSTRVKGRSGVVLGKGSSAKPSERFVMRSQRQPLDSDVNIILPKRGESRSSMLPTKINSTPQTSALLAMNAKPSRPVVIIDSSPIDAASQAQVSPTQAKVKGSSHKFVEGIYTAINEGREMEDKVPKLITESTANLLSKVILTDRPDTERLMSHSLGQGHTDKPRPHSARAPSKESSGQVQLSMGITKNKGFISSWIKLVKPDIGAGQRPRTPHNHRLDTQSSATRARMNEQVQPKSKNRVWEQLATVPVLSSSRTAPALFGQQIDRQEFNSIDAEYLTLRLEPSVVVPETEGEQDIESYFQRAPVFSLDIRRSSHDTSIHEPPTNSLPSEVKDSGGPISDISNRIPETIPDDEQRQLLKAYSYTSLPFSMAPYLPTRSPHRQTESTRGFNGNAPGDTTELAIPKKDKKKLNPVQNQSDQLRTRTTQYPEPSAIAGDPDFPDILQDPIDILSPEQEIMELFEDPNISYSMLEYSESISPTERAES